MTKNFPVIVINELILNSSTVVCPVLRSMLQSIPLVIDADNNNSNNERISRALFHVRHAQLR